MECFVRVNVGGTVFQTTLRTLKPEVRAKMIRAQDEQDNLTFFSDRNASTFPHILDFLRDCTLPPTSLPLDKVELLEKEACFFGIQELVDWSHKRVHQENVVRLNVGGESFWTSPRTLAHAPRILEVMTEFRAANGDKTHFIDRNGSVFGFVLDFLRDGTLPPSSLPLDRVELIGREAGFYGIEQLFKWSESIVTLLGREYGATPPMMKPSGMVGGQEKEQSFGLIETVANSQKAQDHSEQASFTTHQCGIETGVQFTWREVLVLVNQGKLKCLAKADCRAIDFSSLKYLDSVDMSQASLQHASFCNMILKNVVFDAAALLGCKFDGATLWPGCSFQKADLTESYFESATVLGGCSFQEADLTASTFENAHFGGAATNGIDYGQVRFVESKLVKAEFFSGNLQAVAISNCDLQQADFSGCNLQAVVISNCALQQANFSGCNLQAVTISNCDLQHANFDDCTFTSIVRITGCNCKAVSFKRSSLQCCRESYCKAVTFTGANFDWARKNQAIAHFKECDLSDADFTCAKIFAAVDHCHAKTRPVPLSDCANQVNEGINLLSFVRWAINTQNAIHSLDANKAEYNEGRIIVTDSQGKLVQIPPN